MLHQSHLQISFLYVMITAAAQLNSFECSCEFVCRWLCEILSLDAVWHMTTTG